MSDAPEMLDARLYVFSEHNYVREEDYRAVLEQRRGFELAALDNETAAKKAKEQLAACRREFFEYRKVAWENEEIGHKALDDLQQAREAGRREGLYAASDLLRNNGVLLPLIVGETKQDRVVRFALAMADKIEALIDSPKAAGEADAEWEWRVITGLQPPPLTPVWVYGDGYFDCAVYRPGRGFETHAGNRLHTVTHWARIRAVRELVDSPKAEGEEPNATR